VKRAIICIAMILPFLCSSRGAFAYRPFDGTDAAVAESGQAEIELGPAQYVKEGNDRFLVAPAAVLNYGFAKNWETVVEGRVFHGLSSDAPATSLGDVGAFLKTVLREGSLQEAKGPSIASEFGLLLPGVATDHGVGGSLGAIVSQRWELLTIHLNVAGAVTRNGHGDVFSSLIAEGPAAWPVQPVAELVEEHEFGTGHTRSALIGAIWQASDRLSFDIGLRAGRTHGAPLREVRAGLTFSFQTAE
jgi:hypothetical protein